MGIWLSRVSAMFSNIGNPHPHPQWQIGTSSSRGKPGFILRIDHLLTCERYLLQHTVAGLADPGRLLTRLSWHDDVCGGTEVGGREAPGCVAAPQGSCHSSNE